MSCLAVSAGCFAFGVFCPSLARKVKAFFTKEATAAKTAGLAEASKLKTDVEQAAGTELKKL